MAGKRRGSGDSAVSDLDQGALEDAEGGEVVEVGGVVPVSVPGRARACGVPGQACVGWQGSCVWGRRRVCLPGSTKTSACMLARVLARNLTGVCGHVFMGRRERVQHRVVLNLRGNGQEGMPFVPQHICLARAGGKSQGTGCRTLARHRLGSGKSVQARPKVGVGAVDLQAQGTQ